MRGKMQGLLRRVQQRIQELDGSRHLECWFDEVDLEKDDVGNLVLECANAFSLRRLSECHRDTLRTVFQQELGREVSLSFRLSKGTPPARPRREEPTAPPPDHEPPVSQGPSGEAREETRPPPAPLPFPDWNPRYSFSTFIHGPSNGLAWSAANEVCRRFSPQYNPLLIHAPTGLGKTHLGQAIGLRLCQQDRGLRVLFRSAEGFFSEMIQHMRNKTILSFKERYRTSCDLLILDDIQFLRGKEALQTELCYTLDTLLTRGKRVVLIGNLPGRGKNGFDENLESRVYSGLAVSMEPPDYETRLSILTQLARTHGAGVEKEILCGIARCISSHVRDLEGAFARIVAMQALSSVPIRPDTVEELLGTLCQRDGRSLTLEHVQRHVARYFGLMPDDLLSRSRKRNVLLPRQISMLLARKHTHESLEVIGRAHGRDHSSVIYSIRSLKRKMSHSPRIAREVRFVEEKLIEQG